MFITHFGMVTPDVEIDDGIRFSVYAYFCSGVGSRGAPGAGTPLLIIHTLLLHLILAITIKNCSPKLYTRFNLIALIKKFPGGGPPDSRCLQRPAPFFKSSYATVL